jgi:ketosteroid isomerase-like protein
MEKPNLSDLIRKYFSAFLSQDRKTLEAGLSDDFTFNSPRDDHIGKAAYFERCFPNGDKIQSEHIERIFEKGNEAFVRYRAELTDGSKFRNVEYIRFEGDKIKAVDVYFGPAITGNDA